MVHELAEITEVDLLRDVQTEVDEEEELHLQRIDFLARDPTHLGIIQVVEILIVKELGSQHDRSDDDAMNVESSQGKVALLNKAVDVYEGHHQALRAT